MFQIDYLLCLSSFFKEIRLGTCNFQFGFLETETNSIYQSILEQKIGPSFVLLDQKVNFIAYIYLVCTYLSILQN